MSITSAIEFKKAFAKLLVIIRKDRGMTQEELAVKAAIQGSWVSHFECGRRLPSMQVLSRLSSALNCTADMLMPNTAL